MTIYAANHTHVLSSEIVCTSCQDKNGQDRACTIGSRPDNKTVCCHENCLGGCTGPTNLDCKVCRDVVVNQNECVSTCPADTYQFLNRRCITKHECQTMRKPREAAPDVRGYPFKPFKNECTLECPAGYEEVKENGSYRIRRIINISVGKFRVRMMYRRNDSVLS